MVPGVGGSNPLSHPFHDDSGSFRPGVSFCVEQLVVVSGPVDLG